MTAPEPRFVVVVCTRDRPAHLAATLDALEAQGGRGCDVLVVDQSQPPDPGLADRAARNARLRVLRDQGVGLSRSRNRAWRAVDAEWLAYVDDDCRPASGWAAAVRAVLGRVDDVEVVSGPVDGGPAVADPDYLQVTTCSVDEEAVVAGRWTPPWKVGFGVCMVVRRATVERLGGWDERLGVGSLGPFGAAEDMDFNYRLLRSGGRALVTPEISVSHDQWRPAAELPGLYERYMAGWSGFAMKHLRTGDVAGGLWLWSLGVVDALRMLGSAGRRRSRLRLRVGIAKLRGLVGGTVGGLRQPW